MKACSLAIIAGAMLARSASAQATGGACVEQVPAGAVPPVVTDTFPDKGTNGWRSVLEVKVQHGKAETVMPEGLHFQASSDAGKALAQAGFIFVDAPGARPDIQRDPSSQPASTTLSIPLLVLRNEPGRQMLTLPSLPITIARASGEHMVVCTKPHTIAVELPTTNDPNPKVEQNPGPVHQREEWTLAKIVTYALFAGALLALAAAWLFRRLAKRPKRVYIPPPEAPWIVAMRELDRVRASSLLAQGKTDEFFDLVSDAVRKYLGARYGFDGLESTTLEIRAILRRIEPPIADLNRVAEFLSDCDLVKFARLVPNEYDCLQAVSRGEFIIRATMPTTGHLPEPQAKEGS